MTRVLVLVPWDATAGIAPGSGVVTGGDREGTPLGHMRVWFEGNLNGAVNLQRWADRVHNAADRMLTNYPTTAVLEASGDHFRALGFYDPESGTFDWQVPHWREALSEWLGHPVTPEDLTTTVGSHAARRTMQRLRAGSPAEQQQAALLSRQGPHPYRNL